MNLAEIYIEPQKNANSYPVNEALNKGTLFPSLYIPYKYEIKEKNYKSKKDNMYKLLSDLGFAIFDINLYMITHENDEEAMKKFNEYSTEYRKIKTYYESLYGPLSAFSQFNSKVPYTYNKDPWPWEVE